MREVLKTSQSGKDNCWANSLKILLFIASEPAASFAVTDIEFKVKSDRSRSTGRVALLSSSDDRSVK